MLSGLRLFGPKFTALQWITAVGVGVGLILVWGLCGEAYASTLTEENPNGGPQTITFSFPPGFAAFPVLFKSDIAGNGIFTPDKENVAGNELADTLTVTFPGEAARNATGETGQLLQTGFVSSGPLPIDTVVLNEPVTFGTVSSDRVDLFFDTTKGKFAVTFSSDIPEPATALELSTGLAVLLGYCWRRQRRGGARGTTHAADWPPLSLVTS